jgi:hypothetical protein
MFVHIVIQINGTQTCLNQIKVVGVQKESIHELVFIFIS